MEIAQTYNLKTSSSKKKHKHQNKKQTPKPAKKHQEEKNSPTTWILLLIYVFVSLDIKTNNESRLCWTAQQSKNFLFFRLKYCLVNQQLIHLWSLLLYLNLSKVATPP